MTALVAVCALVAFAILVVLLAGLMALIEKLRGDDTRKYGGGK